LVVQESVSQEIWRLGINQVRIITDTNLYDPLITPPGMTSCGIRLLEPPVPVSDSAQWVCMGASNGDGEARHEHRHGQFPRIPVRAGRRDEGRAR
jgi:hypothetical protein